MSSLEALGVLGTGTLGVLASGLIVSSILKLGLEWVFIAGILVFVFAGAAALIARSAG